MPFDSVGAFVAAIEAAADAVEHSQREAVDRAALKLKRAVENERDKAVGSDGRMSGVGSSGAKLGVRYDIKGTRNPTALLRATGPWQLIERDTRPAGRVTGKVGRIRGGRRAARQRALDIAFGARGALRGVKPLRTPFGARYAIKDRGTRGKQPFKRGVERGRQQAMKEFRAVVTRAVAGAFGRS